MVREDAIKLGLVRFMPEHPCVNGHLSERWAKSNLCTECNLAATRRYQKKRPHRDMREYKLKWDKRNAEKLKSYQVFRDREKLFARNVKKLAALRLCTPKWLTPEQKNEIRFIYDLAKDASVTSGEKYEVDHIVPIKGEDVCGLHVPWNLQVLPMNINRSKRNKMETI